MIFVISQPIICLINGDNVLTQIFRNVIYLFFLGELFFVKFIFIRN